jgi:hypothetical protein
MRGRRVRNSILEVSAAGAFALPTVRRQGAHRLHQLHALARQIANGAVLPRQDRACRQDTQSQQVGQVLRIGLIAAVLQSLVLLDRSGIGQMHVEAGVLQAIDQPIPVVGRLEMLGLVADRLAVYNLSAAWGSGESPEALIALLIPLDVAHRSGMISPTVPI